jgi:hypothetical protein
MNLTPAKIYDPSNRVFTLTRDGSIFTNLNIVGTLTNNTTGNAATATLATTATSANAVASGVTNFINGVTNNAGATVNINALTATTATKLATNLTQVIVASTGNSNYFVTIGNTSSNLYWFNTNGAFQGLKWALNGDGSVQYGNGAGTLNSDGTIPAAQLTGTVPGAAEPAFTGDVTKPSGSTVTTLANIPAISGANLTALPASVPILSTVNAFTADNSFQGTTSNAFGLKDTNGNYYFVGDGTNSTIHYPLLTANTLLKLGTQNQVASLANGGNNTVLHGTTPPAYSAVSLSADVTGTLGDGSLSANVPLLNAVQTFSKSNTFTGLVLQTPGNAAAVAMVGYLATGELVTNAVPSSGVPSSRTITIAGTANQITSSAAAQDLSANRTWTLSTPQNIDTAANPQFGSIGLGQAASGTSGRLDLTAGYFQNLSVSNIGNATVGPGNTNWAEFRNTNSGAIAAELALGTNGNVYVGKTLTAGGGTITVTGGGNLVLADNFAQVQGGPTGDTVLERAAAGVWEINKGSLGALRNLNLQTISLTNIIFRATNAAPAGFNVAVTVPAVWFAVTNNAGTGFLIPGYTP